MSSISSLNFVYEPIFHSVSWLIWPRAWNVDILVQNWRTSHFINFLNYFFGLSLLSKFETNIVSSRANAWWGNNHSSGLESFTISKASSCFTCFCPWNFWNLKISSWSRSCILNVFVLTLFIRVYMSGRRSFFREKSAFSLIGHLLFFDWFSISYCTFSLIHCSHRFACKVWGWLIVVKWTNSSGLIRSRSNNSICFNFFLFFGFRLRPRKSSCLYNIGIRVILPRTHFIFLFTFEALNWRLVELQFIRLVLIIAISVNVGGNRGYWLILVDVDEVLKYFGFGGGVSA